MLWLPTPTGEAATVTDASLVLGYLAPDAVLLDMMMPRCDGPNFVRKIRADPRYESLKIFAVSGIEPSTATKLCVVGQRTRRDPIALPRLAQQAVNLAGRRLDLGLVIITQHHPPSRRDNQKRENKVSAEHGHWFTERALEK